MTKKKNPEQEAAKEAEEKAVQDPGLSPSDVNKDSSSAGPVSSAYQGGASPAATTSDNEDN